MSLRPTHTHTARQVVVATSLPKLLAAARAAFAAEGFTALVLDGSPSERAAAAAAFVSTPASRVKALLLNSAADCAGLTLTAANHLFVLEPIPSPPVFAQLCARICRMGQRKHCYVYSVAVERSIEERLLALRQRLAADDSRADAARSLTADSLTPEDLLWLLEHE